MREGLRAGLFTGPGDAIVVTVVAVIPGLVGTANESTCSSYCVPAPAVTWKTAS